VTPGFRFYFDARDQRRQNVDLNAPDRPPVESVDPTEERSDEKRSVTINVGGMETNIDYTVQFVGNTAIIPPDSYERKVRIPQTVKSVGVPIYRHESSPSMIPTGREIRRSIYVP
jgi:hypothetical protein